MDQATQLVLMYRTTLTQGAFMLVHRTVAVGARRTHAQAHANVLNSLSRRRDGRETGKEEKGEFFFF